MKTKEELNAIKEEVEAVSKKLNELTEEELKEVIGGAGFYPSPEIKGLTQIPQYIAQGGALSFGSEPSEHNIFLNGSEK